MEPSKKEKEGNGGRDRAVKMEGEAAKMRDEDSSLHLGPKSEPGKRCCCLSLFRL
jgi:hypothetical protein